jgi:argininosuccinate lyase
MNGVKKATTVRGSDIFPAPVYRRTVLEEIFKNAQVYFLEPLLAIERAHTLMLARQKIIPQESAAICLRGLERLDAEQIKREPYDPDVEDLYFYIEKN